MNSKRTLKSVGIALLITAAVATVGFGPEEEQKLADFASNSYARTPAVDIGLSAIPHPSPFVASETSASMVHTGESGGVLSPDDFSMGDSEISQPRPLVTPDTWTSGISPRRER